MAVLVQAISGPGSRQQDWHTKKRKDNSKTTDLNDVVCVGPVSALSPVAYQCSNAALVRIWHHLDQRSISGGKYMINTIFALGLLWLSRPLVIFLVHRVWAKCPMQHFICCSPDRQESLTVTQFITKFANGCFESLWKHILQHIVFKQQFDLRALNPNRPNWSPIKVRLHVRGRNKYFDSGHHQRKGKPSYMYFT